MKFNKVALKHGFRSGLEDQLNESLKKSKKSYGYETQKLLYIIPESKHSYTPDFILTKKNNENLFIESKGRWVKTDRLKFDFIFQQYPSIDLRFVFSNPNAKLYKGSKTTYAQYCDKKGWKWAAKEIPKDWLQECI